MIKDDTVLILAAVFSLHSGVVSKDVVVWMSLLFSVGYLLLSSLKAYKNNLKRKIKALKALEDNILDKGE